MATRARLTEKDLDRLPDDGQRYEIVNGELHVTPPPILAHQSASLVLTALLYRAEEAGYGRAFAAPARVVLAPDEVVVEPDLIFVRQDRLAILQRAKVEGSPDLLVEILSPRTRNYDLVVKKDAYAAAGVPWYWVVDLQAREVRVYALRDGAYVETAILRAGDSLSCPLFPGITLDDVARLFR